MLNVYELENRWLKYKLKKLLPFAILLLSLVVISSITFFFFQNKEETKQQLNALNQKKHIEQAIRQKEENNSVINVQVAEKNQTIPKKPEPVITKVEPVKKTDDTDVVKNNVSNKNEKLKLSPSMNFIRTMRDDTLPYYEHEDIPEQSSVPIPSSKPVQETRDAQTSSANSEIETTKPDIKITVKTSQKEIEDVIKRFKKSNNPALSLFIAKKYYELGDYDKSYNYALITNEINRDIEASWLIFSRSLVKLHKKDMAIKTLKQYIKQSGSDKAKRLLNEIQIGRFK